MVLAFIASLASPVIHELTFTTGDPTLRESVSLAVGALAIALIMWRAPAIAMAFIAGSTSLDFNSSALQPALSAGNGAMGISRVVSGAARASGSALNTVAQAARQGANRVSNFIK